MSAGLLELLAKIKNGLHRGIYTNESAVREAIILPVLRSLRWDDLDPGSVRREYDLKGRRVDYGLFTHHSAPDLLIEVKAVGLLTGGDKQLFEYAYHDGVPMAVLTSGQEWSFYLPAGQGSYDDRRFFKLDLLGQSEAFSAEALTKYLDFERVRSKTAIEDARKDYETASKTRKALQTLHVAWNELLTEPDDLLVDLLIEKTETLCGYAPNKEETEIFVRNLVKQITPENITIQKPQISLMVQKDKPSNNVVNPKTFSPGQPQKVTITIDGRQSVPRDAITGLREILVHLSHRDATFLQKLAVRARGQSRNYIAQSKEEIHPKRPDLASLSVELEPGWYMDTNISNRTKSKIVTWACEVSGLQRGEKIDFIAPNI